LNGTSRDEDDRSSLDRDLLSEEGINLQPCGRGRQSHRRGLSNRSVRMGSSTRGRGRGTSNCVIRNQPPPHFNWKPVDFLDDFDMDWFGTPQQRGVLIDTTDYQPVDYFKYFFPDQLFDLIVTNTNLYASQFLQNQTDLGTHSRYHKWRETNSNEMQAYIALQIAMGLNNKPELPDYWGTYWLTANTFCDIMSRNRYQLLTTFLHFCDNSTRVPRGEEGYDPLFKIRQVINIVDPRYQTAYVPDKELAIDESMIKFKGRIFFRQYMPAKPTMWGIKTFALCESNTGYALRFIIYTGKNTFEVDRSSKLTITEQVCLELMRGYEDRGYQLYMDNFYSSPQLFNELKQRGVGACGTVKHNRKFMPYDLQPSVLALNKGDDPVFMRCQDLVTCAMMDTKRVHFLSSIHSDNTFEKIVRDRKSVGGHRTVVRPVMCDAYNDHMNGVDVLDQKLGSYSYPHKCAKWYMTIFHRIREVALVNGYIIYCKSVPTGKKPMAAVMFREKVIDGLLDGWEMCSSKKGRPSVTEKPDRLTGRHFPAQYTDPKHRPECVVCSDRTIKKRVQTRFYCRNCGKPMCATDCFMLYHTQKFFRGAARNNMRN